MEYIKIYQQSIKEKNMMLKNKSETWRKRDFYLWLRCYELMSKSEFEELPKYKQENYRLEFQMFREGKSQYNINY